MSGAGAGAVSVTTPEGIALYRLTALRAAVGLEILGMTRRGRSACAVARETLGLPAREPKRAVWDALDALVIQLGGTPGRRPGGDK